MWLLAAAVRDTPAAQLAALADGVPLLLGRILNASADTGCMGGPGTDTSPSKGAQNEEEVLTGTAELQIACCSALEALLDGCTAVQVCLHC